jgi:hypothetical protein
VDRALAAQLASTATMTVKNEVHKARVICFMVLPPFSSMAHV